MTTVDPQYEDQGETTEGFASSNIASFTYFKSIDQLHVVFNDGSEYDYYNVPPSVHRMFQAAGSKGEFFARQIKGRFAYNQA